MQIRTCLYIWCKSVYIYIHIKTWIQNVFKGKSSYMCCKNHIFERIYFCCQKIDQVCLMWPPINLHTYFRSFMIERIAHEKSRARIYCSTYTFSVFNVRIIKVLEQKWSTCVYAKKYPANLHEQAHTHTHIYFHTYTHDWNTFIYMHIYIYIYICILT